MGDTGQQAANGTNPQTPPGPPFKVYVAGVPKSFAAEDLQPYFDRFGPIESTVILVEKGGSGLSRGCAFVNFATNEAASAAISAMDNQVILPGGPYNLRVRYANRPGDSRRPLSAGPAATLSEVDRRRVFFTRGPPGVEQNTVHEAFAPYGDIEETNLFPDKVSGKTKGCGFVTFKSQEQAQNAMNALNGALTLPGISQPLSVNWADPERRAALKRKFAGEPEPERQVFFAKVPRAATESDVMALFAGLGSVEDVVLFKASGAQHHKGCGLATFADHQSAADAILALDGVYMWPNFHDPMVVKWMDRSMQKAKRPDGSWAPWGGQQGAYGAPAAAPPAGPPVIDQAAVQAAQQAAQQAWQQRISQQQDWQAPAGSSYSSASHCDQNYSQQPQYGSAQPQYGSAQPHYDGGQPQYDTQGQYAGQQGGYLPPAGQYGDQAAYNQPQPGDYGQPPAAAPDYGNGYAPPPAPGGYAYQDAAVKQGQYGQQYSQQYSQAPYTGGGAPNRQPQQQAIKAEPQQGPGAPGGGFQAPLQPGYGASGTGAPPMYSAVGQHSGRAPPPSGAPPAGPPPALPAYGVPPLAGSSYDYSSPPPPQQQQQRQQQHQHQQHHQPQPLQGGYSGPGGAPPLFPIQGGGPAPPAGHYGGGPPPAGGPRPPAYSQGY